MIAGEVRVKHGEEVIEAVAGSLVYGPRGVAHGFHVDVSRSASHLPRIDQRDLGLRVL